MKDEGINFWRVVFPSGEPRQRVHDLVGARLCVRILTNSGVFIVGTGVRVYRVKHAVYGGNANVVF